LAEAVNEKASALKQLDILSKERDQALEEQSRAKHDKQLMQVEVSKMRDQV